MNLLHGTFKAQWSQDCLSVNKLICSQQNQTYKSQNVFVFQRYQIPANIMVPASQRTSTMIPTTQYHYSRPDDEHMERSLPSLLNV